MKLQRIHREHYTFTDANCMFYNLRYDVDINREWKRDNIKEGCTCLVWRVGIFGRKLLFRYSRISLKDGQNKFSFFRMPKK